MVKINWTSLAVSDLKNVFDFIAYDSSRYAQITVSKIHYRVQTLEDQPYSGRMVPGFEETTIRELISGNYRILYSIVNDYQIDVLRIYHSARSLKEKDLK
jgi:toxin ParE1/3/4